MPGTARLISEEDVEVRKPVMCGTGVYEEKSTYRATLPASLALIGIQWNLPKGITCLKVREIAGTESVPSK